MRPYVLVDPKIVLFRRNEIKLPRIVTQPGVNVRRIPRYAAELARGTDTQPCLEVCAGVSHMLGSKDPAATLKILLEVILNLGSPAQHHSL